MADIKEYPEHILEMIDLVSTILRRIKENRLDKSRNECLYMTQAKGVAH